MTIKYITNNLKKDVDLLLLANFVLLFTHNNINKYIRINILYLKLSVIDCKLFVIKKKHFKIKKKIKKKYFHIKKLLLVKFIKLKLEKLIFKTVYINTNKQMKNLFQMFYIKRLLKIPKKAII